MRDICDLVYKCHNRRSPRVRDAVTVTLVSSLISSHCSHWSKLGTLNTNFNFTFLWRLIKHRIFLHNIAWLTVRQPCNENMKCKYHEMFKGEVHPKTKFTLNALLASKKHQAAWFAQQFALFFEKNRCEYWFATDCTIGAERWQRTVRDVISSKDCKYFRFRLVFILRSGTVSCLLWTNIPLKVALKAKILG